MIKEFIWRIKRLGHRAAPKDPDSHFVFRGTGYVCWRSSHDALAPDELVVQTHITPVAMIEIFSKKKGRGGRIKVEDYEAEEVLMLMRQDMVLDELADV